VAKLVSAVLEEESSHPRRGLRRRFPVSLRRCSVTPAQADISPTTRPSANLIVQSILLSQPCAVQTAAGAMEETSRSASLSTRYWPPRGQHSRGAACSS
jgi:hypothetical protein